MEIVDKRWQLSELAPLEDLVTGVVCAALDACDRHDPVEISVRLTYDAEIRSLNRDWCDQDKPTNVLSFALDADAVPDNCAVPLGDVVVAFETCQRESAEEAKPLANHLSHLVVHGTLHLLSYDHEVAEEAEIMEALERRVLAGLGIPDPYADSVAVTRKMTGLPQNGAPSLPPTERSTGSNGNGAPWWRRLFGNRNGENSVREAIEVLIEEPGPEVAAINADESLLIANILKLHNVTAEDVMVPRADIIAMDENAELHAVADLMSEAAHSRLPVYHEQLDEVVGFVHMKDVLATLRAAPHQRVHELKRDILFAAPSIRVLDLLLEMRAQRTHMAIVVDEFGGVDGLVTIEDLVEEIVGEIEDEHDEDGPNMTLNPDGSILADARTEIEELEEQIGAFVTDEEREESDTLGGVVFLLIDRIPRRSEVVSHDSGVEFEVVDADARRIKRLRVRDLRKAENASKTS